MREITKETPIPLYYQLEEILRDQIEAGPLKPMDRIPSEEDLSRQYNVSRTTVRHALDRLVLDGLVIRTPGRGTVVAKPKVEEASQWITGSYADLASRGHKVATRVFECALVTPPEKVRTLLQLPEGERVFKLDRLRIVDDEPLFLTTAYVPFRLCPELVNEDFERHSFFEILENKYQLIIMRSVRTLEPTLATPKEAQLLMIKEKSPIHLVESVSYLEDGTPIEYSKSRYRGDRSKFEVQLIRTRKGEPVPIG